MQAKGKNGAAQKAMAISSERSVLCEGGAAIVHVLKKRALLRVHNHMDLGSTRVEYSSRRPGRD